MPLDSSSLTYAVNTGNNQTVQINQVIFPVANVSTDQNGVQKIEYVWTAPNGKTIKHQFALAKGKFNVDWNIVMDGADQLLTNNQLNVLWDVHSYGQEKTTTYERQMSNICFSEGNEFDYISSNTNKVFEKPVPHKLLFFLAHMRAHPTTHSIDYSSTTDLFLL